MVYQPTESWGPPFWTQWKKHFTLIPTKSITGKWVWGYVNKRKFIIPDGGFRSSWTDRVEYATDREKFLSELGDRNGPPTPS